MTMTLNRRYDLQPLLEHTGLTRRQLQTELQISWTTLIRLEHDGLTDEAADRYAIRLGHYPWQIWPTWFDDVKTWDPDHPSLHTRTRPVAPQPPSSEAS